MRDFFQSLNIGKYGITCLLFAFACLQAGGLGAQDPGDLYLLEGSIARDTFLVNRIRFLNDFNKGSYNNQPTFIDEHRILVTCQLQGSQQSDIWMLHTEEKIRTNLSVSPQREYSAAPVPGDGGFSCVRVETEPAGKQTIMHYFPGMPPNVVPIYNGPLQIGYYQWLDAQRLALFVLATPDRHELQLLDLSTGRTTLIAQSPGRCLRKTPEGHLAYVSKADSSFWFLKTFDPMTLQSSIIHKCPAGSEDFELLSDGTWIMGQGSRLLALNPGASGWKEIADLQQAGIRRIGRLSCWKREQLVLVNQP